MAFFVCFGVSCQPEQQVGSSQTSPPTLPGKKLDGQAEASSMSAPVELADLQPTTSPALAPAARVIEQAAPVTYTWKAIERVPHSPTSAPANTPSLDEPAKDWEPTQPVVIFPDNISGQSGKGPAESTFNEQPGEVEHKKVKTLSSDQLALFDQLQDKILKLMLALRQAEEQNSRMQQSFIEASSVARLGREELSRKLVQIEMDQSEIADLKERLAKATSAAKATTPPASTTQPGDKLDAAQLRRRIEKLKLQLKLANMQGPDKVRQLSTKLAEMSERFSDMEDIHVRLSHLVVVQADQIKALQAERRARQVASMTKFGASGKKDLMKIAQAETKPKIIIGQIKTINGPKVMIDMGSQKGLKTGMRMIVHRGDKFIGYLRLDKIDQAESAGTIVRKVLEPEIGDKVIDRLE